MTKRLCAAATLAFTAALTASAALAHPHMFVDARSEFAVDEAGRLTGLSTVMLIDELTTLFVLEEHGVFTADAPLSDAKREAIGAGLIAGLGDYDYFTTLEIDGARVAFADAKITALRLDDARLAATLELTLAAPQALRGRTLELGLYDPTYFAAVDTLTAPILPPAAEGCRSRLFDFEPTQLDSVSLFKLGALSREETPEDPRVGARFADWSTITCAP